jgi:hypothetical protein
MKMGLSSPLVSLLSAPRQYLVLVPSTASASCASTQQSEEEEEAAVVAAVGVAEDLLLVFSRKPKIAHSSFAHNAQKKKHSGRMRA